MIDLYFHDCKLAIEIDENGHTDRNKKTKAIGKEFGCKFTRMDPDKEDFDIFRAINEIFRDIKQSTKKTLINNISTRLEFKSDNITKSKGIRFIVKKILPDYI